VGDEIRELTVDELLEIQAQKLAELAETNGHAV
jgi:hypothetical protein